MKISVIIPTFKPRPYIEECLTSLKKQTLSKDQFEVLVILNGCAEPWLSNLKKIIEDIPDVNIRLIQTDQPGVSNARNIGLENATGEFIAFIDDDDYVSPDYLKELLEVSSADCVGLSDSIYFDDESGKNDFSNIHHQEYLKLIGKKKLSLYKTRRFFNGPVMKIIHKSIIQDRRFDIRFRNGEDSLFMALISDRIMQVRFSTNKAIYFRRIRKGSATTSSRSFFKRIGNGFKLIIQYIKYLINNPQKYNYIFFSSRIVGALKI